MEVFFSWFAETTDEQVIATLRGYGRYNGTIQERERPPDPPRVEPPVTRLRAFPPVIPRLVLGDW